MNLRYEVVQAMEARGGRILCAELAELFREELNKSSESRRAFKKIVASVALIEIGEDKRRYLVLKELVGNKENILAEKKSETPISDKNNDDDAPRSSNTSVGETHNPVQKLSTHPYSTYTSNEPWLWWMASLECRHVEMARLLGLNPKLINWNNPVDGTAVHYAGKFGNLTCLKLLIRQYHASVNVRNRGQTPLHLAVLHSQATAIRALVKDYGADTDVRDFSGRLPVFYLSDELRSEFEDFLTPSRIRRTRTYLEMLIPSMSKPEVGTSRDSSIIRFPTPYPSEFRRPIPVRCNQRTYDFVSVLHSPTRAGPSVRRTSTLKPGNDGLSRRTSVLMDLLRSATSVIHDGRSTGDVNAVESNGISSTCTSKHLSLLREKESKMPGLSETNSFDSSGSSESGSLVSQHISLKYGCPLSRSDLSLPVPASHLLIGRPPPGADARMLNVLLSLLPPPPQEFLDSDSKRPTNKHYKTFKPRRSSSSHLSNDLSGWTDNEHSGKVHRHFSFSRSAAVAETDMYGLFTRMHKAVQRKRSTKSLSYDPDPAIRGSHDRSFPSNRLPISFRSLSGSLSLNHSSAHT
ncbi:unnamed protein product [Calicophoron daubneyi]|uniref:SOWAHA-C winged helix-turn-helix domain-containing protein n=1 Tax=Calicophoron daubneyi TaxID=300641 RepID=A0AAV2TUN5_CALDB